MLQHFPEKISNKRALRDGRRFVFFITKTKNMEFRERRVLRS